MSFSKTYRALVALLFFPLFALAQTQSVPGEIKGRWKYENLSNIFMLREIKVEPDHSFTAKLEWWTANRRCSIIGEPVSGKLTDKGIAWDMVTKSPCNNPYSVELNRREKGWDGKITSKDSATVAELTAE